MPRRSTGQLIEPDGERQRSFALRFRANGKRQFLTLGRPEDGWTRDRAEAELRHVLADVERGIWSPPEPAPEPQSSEPQTLGSFPRASGWSDIVRSGATRPLGITNGHCAT